MRKIALLAAFLVPAFLPLISSAQVSSNYFVATDSAATSSFSGALSVSGQMQLPSLVDGVVSSVGGYLSTASNFVYNAATGFLGVGTSTQISSDYWDFLKETTSGSPAISSINNYNTGAPNPILVFRAARGTQSSTSAVQNNDTLGRIAFNGYDGTAFAATSPAQIYSYAQDNWTSSDHGANIGFVVTAPGTTTKVQMMTLSGSGLTVNGNVSAASFSTSTFQAINSNGNIDAPSFTTGGSITIRSGGNLLVGTTSTHDTVTVDGGIYASGHMAGATFTSSGDAAVGTTTNFVHPGLGVIGTFEVTNPGTTTIDFDSSGGSQGSCLVMKDSDGGGYTYITTYRGTLTASTNPCN